MRMRFHPVLVTGDLKQAFLQVRINKEERDAHRFDWKTTEKSVVETLRFTGALLGLWHQLFFLMLSSNATLNPGSLECQN